MYCQIRCFSVSRPKAKFFFFGLYAESQTENISSAVAAVLPDLPVAVFNSVEDALKALGAETRDHLQDITEGDLLPLLKPIQVRRLVAAWAQSSKCTLTTFFNI